MLQQTRIPIIFTCNRIPREMDSLNLPILHFNRYSQIQCVSHLETSLYGEGLILPLKILHNTCVQYGNDIRKCLNQLQFWCSGSLTPAQLTEKKLNETHKKKRKKISVIPDPPEKSKDMKKQNLRRKQKKTLVMIMI
eukprot:UN26144